MERVAWHVPWASYQIRKMPGTFSRHRLLRKPPVSDPDMHHGTYITQVPWCMSGTPNRGGGEKFPAHAQPANLRIWQEAHWASARAQAEAMWAIYLHCPGQWTQAIRVQLATLDLLNVWIYCLGLFGIRNHLRNWWWIPPLKMMDIERVRMRNQLWCHNKPQWGVFDTHIVFNITMFY